MGRVCSYSPYRSLLNYWQEPSQLLAGAFPIIGRSLLKIRKDPAGSFVDMWIITKAPTNNNKQTVCVFFLLHRARMSNKYKTSFFVVVGRSLCYDLHINKGPCRVLSYLSKDPSLYLEASCQ